MFYFTYVWFYEIVLYTYIVIRKLISYQYDMQALYWFSSSKSKLFRLSSENLERDEFLPISACAGCHSYSKDDKWYPNTSYICEYA